MKYTIFFLILSLIILFKVGYIGIGSTNETQSIPINSPIPITELDSDKLWNLVQEWRQSQKLSPHIKSQDLCKIAEDRADDGPDYHKGLLEKYSDYPYKSAENAVYNALSEQNALEGWLDSPKHLANLQLPWSHSCIACYKRNCVQIFSSFKEQ